MYSVKGNVGKVGNGGLSIEAARKQLTVRGINCNPDQLEALLCEHGWVKREKSGELVPAQSSLDRGYMLQVSSISLDSTGNIMLRRVAKLTETGLAYLFVGLRARTGNGLYL